MVMGMEVYMGVVCMVCRIGGWVASSKAMVAGLKNSDKKSFKWVYTRMSYTPATPTFVQDGVSMLFQFVTISSTIRLSGFKIYIRNKGGFFKITISGMLLWLLLLYGCLSHQFLIKDISGSQGPESGYCSLSNLSLQPASYPGLGYCQEERPRRGGKNTDSPKEAGQMPK